MKDLFIEPVSFEKTADIQLTENMMMWPNEITAALFKKFPIMTKSPYSVMFNTRNDKLRSAKGTLSVGPMEIPFVIEGGLLKPMLVYYLQGQDLTNVMPLTGSVAERILSPKTFAKGLVDYTKPEKKNVSVSGEYRLKAGSLLENLDGTVYETDKKALLNELSSYQFTPPDVITKVASLRTMEPSNLTRDIPEDIYYIFKNAGLGWTKYSGNSRFYKNASTFLKDTEVKDTPLVKTTVKGAALTFMKQAEVSDVINYKGSSYKVLGLDLNHYFSSHILMDKKGNYISDLEKTAEWEYSKESVNLPKVKSVSPGEYVLVKTAENKYLGPVFVSSYYKDKGQARLIGTSDFEKVAFYEDNRFEKTVYDKNKIYVPELEMIKVGSKVTVSRPLTKTERFSHTVTKHQNDYYLVGPEFKKYAELCGSTGVYNKHDAIWALIQLGASEDTITKIAEMISGEVKIVDFLQSPVKYAEKITDDRKLVASYIDTKFKGLLKEAVSIADETSLDVVLGLNLINEENIAALLNNMGVIDMTLNLLSKLWLMSNIGLKSIDLGALEIVLRKLTEIRDSLEKLAYVLKVH